MWLFLAFLLVPLIEIALFIQVGGFIGLWPTLSIVIGTALLGTLLVRAQGTAAMADLRSSMNRLENPTTPLAHGAMILFSAALLLTPGFFTDGVGFALLLPPVRSWIITRVSARMAERQAEFARHQGERGHPSTGPVIIEGEFVEASEPVPPSDETPGTSGWTRH